MDDKWQPWVQQMDVHHSVNKISLAYSSCADQQFVIYPVDGLVSITVHFILTSLELPEHTSNAN